MQTFSEQTAQSSTRRMPHETRNRFRGTYETREAFEKRLDHICGEIQRLLDDMRNNGKMLARFRIANVRSLIESLEQLQKRYPPYSPEIGVYIDELKKIERLCSSGSSLSSNAVLGEKTVLGFLARFPQKHFLIRGGLYEGMGLD